MEEAKLSRLLGYLFGDANLRERKRYGRKGTQTEISIEATDLSMVEDFAELCKILLNKQTINIASRKRFKNWRETFGFSTKVNKKISEFLHGFSPTYRKKPENGKYPDCKIPAFVFKNPTNIKNFLQAFVNSEGSVRLRVIKHNKWWELQRYVKISNKHPALLKAISEMLTNIGIDHRFHPPKEATSIIIQQKYAIMKFWNEIGFLNGIKVSPRGIWGNYEKKLVLKTIVNSFKIPKGKLQEFKNEKEIYDFLKNLNYFPEMDSET